MKQFIIRCDVEGVTGVVSYDQAEPGKPEFEFGRRMFFHDLKAMEEGLLDGGADDIIIYDIHYYGRNIDPLTVSGKTKIISGKPPYREDWSGGVTEETTGLLLLGFHGMAGAAGLLPHTYEHDIKEITLNGIKVGEIGMEAAVAGDRGVPLLLAVGDKAGMEEAEALVEGVKTVTVKEGFSESGGICLSGKTTGDLIYKAAKNVAMGKTGATPFLLERPVELVILFHPGEYAEYYGKLFPEDQIGENQIRIEAGNVSGAYGNYWKKKLAVKAYKENR